MNFKKVLFSSMTSVFCMLLLSSLLAPSSNAQTGSSSVRGTVTDAQGKAVSGATVTLLNSSKNFSRTQITNDDGNYIFTAVPPDTYQVKVEAKGFKTATVPNVQALIDTPKELDVSLDVGDVNETVTVQTSETAPLNTSDASLGNAIEQRRIIDLPLSARNTPDLLSLQPGVTPKRDDFPDIGGSVNGGRSDQSNVLLDGVDVNEQQGGRSFFSVLRVTPEELQEFRVITTNSNADVGRSSGAQISLYTRTGKNNFGGSLYLYQRPGTWGQANDFFNNKAGIPTPSVKRSNFGGSFSGPIFKNRLFFFFNYERFQEDKESPVTQEVPLPTLGQGMVRYRSTDTSFVDPNCPSGTPVGVRCFTASQISQQYATANGGMTPGTNPIAYGVLADAARRYVANDTTFGDRLNTSGFRFNAPAPIRNNISTLRLDGKLTSNQDVFVRYKYQFDNETGSSRFPDSPSTVNWIHPQGVAAGHTWTINSNMVNKFTYGLTRDSFTLGGDSDQNFITFRFIYRPRDFSRAVSRVTPVHNFVDDFTWVKGNHTISTGVNIRFISNQRTTFTNSYDFASTNPSFYDASGEALLLSDSGADIFPQVASSTRLDLRDALAAVIGRFSQYSATLQFDAGGRLQPSGVGVGRTFKTEEYEVYAQDSWRIRNSLTVNYGMRWSTSTPVYEANGLQVKPNSLNDFFNSRVTGAFNGTPFNGLITVDKAGKANGRSGYYSQDWNNFAPSISAAWSPHFKDGFLKWLLGDGKSTFRGGFRMTYDRVGSALAVAFDLNSTLGFSSSSEISANTFNVTTSLGPLFTGFNQNLRTPLFFGPTAPRPSLQGSLTFPLQTPADEEQRIEQSLDDKLTTPYNYNYNFSYGRDLGKGFALELSYVGRKARSLLISRDVAHFNNLRDPVSGQDFYSAIRQLINYRESNTPITAVPNIAWFQKFVPGLAGTFTVNGVPTALTATQNAYRRIARACSNNAPRTGGVCPSGTFSINGQNLTDYTFVQVIWDDGRGFGNNIFIHPQYATFAAYSTIGSSDYDSFQMSLRKRFSAGLMFDLNYTYGHSLDDASGNESSDTISSGASLLLNPLTLRENRASSDFDVRHLINANFIYELPFGKNRMFFSNSGKVANAILGGWQMTGIFRFNTGFPIGQPFDDGRWATNWNVQSNGVALVRFDSSPTKNGAGGSPNIFSDQVAAYRSFRNAYPGEQGDRNILREPNYIVLDMGLYKSITFAERHKVTLRFEVFNVTNTQRLTGISTFRLGQDPQYAESTGGNPPTDFGRLTTVIGAPRIIQFAVRYDF
jgi:hypothetical protein